MPDTHFQVEKTPLAATDSNQSSNVMSKVQNSETSLNDKVEVKSEILNLGKELRLDACNFMAGAVLCLGLVFCSSAAGTYLLVKPGLPPKESVLTFIVFEACLLLLSFGCFFLYEKTQARVNKLTRMIWAQAFLQSNRVNQNERERLLVLLSMLEVPVKNGTLKTLLASPEPTKSVTLNLPLNKEAQETLKTLLAQANQPSNQQELAK